MHTLCYEIRIELFWYAAPVVRICWSHIRTRWGLWI